MSQMKKRIDIGTKALAFALLSATAVFLVDMAVGIKNAKWTLYVATIPLSLAAGAFFSGDEEDDAPPLTMKQKYADTLHSQLLTHKHDPLPEWTAAVKAADQLLQTVGEIDDEARQMLNPTIKAIEVQTPDGNVHLPPQRKQPELPHSNDDIWADSAAAGQKEKDQSRSKGNVIAGRFRSLPGNDERDKPSGVYFIPPV